MTMTQLSSQSMNNKIHHNHSLKYKSYNSYGIIDQIVHLNLIFW